MTSIRYLQILLIITFTSGAVWRSCEPGEEFKSHNLTCDVQVNDNFRISRNNIYVSSCSLQPTPNCDPPDSPYNISLTGEIVTLNIINTTRSTEGNYSFRGNNSSWCDFKIYAKPENVSCQVSPSPTNNVTVTCNVTKIYPSATCQFFWYINVTESSLPKQYITYQNMSGQDQSDYFYQTCTLTQPAQNLGLGSHAFKVRAYPNITGNTSDANYGVNSSQILNVTINYPVVQLESCPQGNVQDGSSFKCSCRETANSFLSATVTFTQGTLVDSSESGFITYTFTANRSNTQDLTCKASLLNWTSSVATYKPQVAYGPKNVTVKVANLTKSGDINLCDKPKPVMVTVTCVVDGNDTSPGANFEFTINGSRTASNPVNGSSLTFGVANSGNLSVGCIGNNSALQQITARSTELHVQVIEPPASPPVIENVPNSGSPVKGYLTVQEGNTMIMCRADGGYPPVASVSVDCGGLTNTSMGNVAFLDVAVNRSMDASNCSCTATHSSTCYWNNNTVVNLNVHFSGAPPTDGTDSHVGAIVGGVVGGILAIVLVVLIVIFLKKRGTFDRKKPAASATRLPNDDGSDEHQVVFDNTELYTSSQKLNEVVFDNSDLYNFNRNADPVNTGKDPKYRSYSDITPTMTSASAMPGNTTLNKPQAQSSPYEDVNLNEMSSKNNVKPKPASKPKPIPKPKPGDKGDPHDVKGTPADQVYATVVKVSKASKPFVCKETSPPSSPQPEIPNKMFEKFDKNSFNSKKRASHGNQDSSTCTNNGFSDLEDDINVYSNTDQ